MVKTTNRYSSIGNDRPFSGVELKIARARFHAQSLIDSVEQWHKNPITAHAEISADRRSYKLVLNDFAVAPPVELWAMMVGDCAHNLRSALDNLCYGAARIKLDPPATPKAIQFPVFDDEDKYWKSDVVQKALRELPREAADLIEHFQPFKHPDHRTNKSHSLLVLQHLNNQDKHRIPQIALLQVEQHGHRQQLTFETESDAKAWTEANPQLVLDFGPVCPGSVLMSVTCSQPAGKVLGIVNLAVRPAIETLIGFEAAIPTLEQLGIQVQTIFEAFRHTFPNARD